MLENKGEREYCISSKDGSIYSILYVNGKQLDGSFRRHKDHDFSTYTEMKYGVVNDPNSENYGKFYSYLNNKNTNKKIKGSWKWMTVAECESVFNVDRAADLQEFK